MTALQVAPIVKGYPFTFTLQFAKPDGSALFVPAPDRVRGEFRAGPDPTLYQTIFGAVDSAASPSTLTINSDGSITFTMSESVTSGFPIANVALDFARVDAGVSSPVGVLIWWPVIAPVTAAPT